LIEARGLKVHGKKYTNIGQFYKVP